jgi:hypothetical protein
MYQLKSQTRFVVVLCFALTASNAAFGQDDKGKTAAKATGPEIGEVRVRDLAAVSYAYVATETTFDKLGEVIGAALPKIQKAADDGKLKLGGPFVLTYPQGSAHLTPDQPFKVHIGLMVAGESRGDGEVQVRKTEPFKAATVLYTGPVSGIGECRDGASRREVRRAIGGGKRSTRTALSFTRIELPPDDPDSDQE